MKLSDLVKDPGTGQLSHTKIWANIAYAASTVSFCWMNFKGTASPDIWFIYLGVVGVHGAASKLISMKYGSASVQSQ